MSKTIEIKKVHLRNLFLSFILGFGILYGLEHFGSFSYLPDSPNQNDNKKISMIENLPGKTKVLTICFKSYFGNIIETKGNGFVLYDMIFKDSDFTKYSVKSYYYTQAAMKDYKYGIYISFGIFLILLLFTNYKIKLTK